VVKKGIGQAWDAEIWLSRHWIVLCVPTDWTTKWWRGIRVGGMW